MAFCRVAPRRSSDLSSDEMKSWRLTGIAYNSTPSTSLVHPNTLILHGPLRLTSCDTNDVPSQFKFSSPALKSIFVLSFSSPIELPLKYGDRTGWTYRITNARLGTVLDVAGDDISVVGSQWISTGTESELDYRLDNSLLLFGLYVGLADSAGDGTRLVVSALPFRWDIWYDTADPRRFLFGTPILIGTSRIMEVQLPTLHLPLSGIPIKMALFTRRGHLTDYDYMNSLNDVIDNQSHPVFYVLHALLSAADYSS